MQNVKLINARTLFIRLTCILMLPLLVIVCIFSKSTSFIAANPFHSGWLDNVFIIITNLGDGLFAIGLAILLFLLRKKTIALKLVLSFLLSGIAAQLLKSLFHAPRPRLFLSPHTYSHFIDHVTNTGFTSFPSGHATTAFAVASILAFNIPCRRWCCGLFMFAMIVVYSRIYLGQHFIEDTMAGILIGVVSSLAIEYLYQRPIHRFIRQKRSRIYKREPISLEL